MSSFILKIIALTAMLIDHTGILLYDVPELRIIGRIAFPIFVFLCAQGCAHTSDIKKYMARLFIFAFISEIPFDLLMNIRRVRYYGMSGLAFFDWSGCNVFFTLLLGVTAVYLYERLKKIDVFAAAFVVIPCAYAAYVINADYRAAGVLAVFFTYLAPGKFLKAGVISALVLFLYKSSMPWLFGGLAAVLPLLFYNGKRGPGLKWWFYAAYPAHLAVLAVIGAVLYIG